MQRALLGFFLVFSIALPVHAEPDFPAAIQRAASIPCPPPCTLCHTVTPGTAVTATKPFALTVIQSGKLVSLHAGSLQAVVLALRENKLDTDGDGQLDVDELALGSDPSDANPSAELCGPTYGCGARVAKVAPRGVDGMACGFAAALTLILFSRMRRERSTEAR